ncbi:MAG: alpha/beta fold hydrolase [Symbiobacterium sp.]|uniref:alpha/beta hydrolase n=1 Tax=Symbiobacterium sp. TaxID=1971213 RepID=UPI003463B21E
MPIVARSGEPVFVRGGPVGCLALHGFGGSPAEIGPVVAALAERGYTVAAPVLPGHGGAPPELARTRFRHWIRGAEQALEHLEAECAHVHLVGFSMGGLIALHVAARREVGSVCTLAVPVLLEDPAPLMDHLARYLNPPPGAIRSLVRLARLVRRDLGRVTAPVLALQGDRDRWIAPESAAYLVSHVSSRHAVCRVLAGRGHFLALERGRKEVAAQVADWIASSEIGWRP